MAPKRTFKEKTVVITGAAGGIGTALAHRFAAAGSRLGLLDIDEGGLQALSRQLDRRNIPNSAVAFDITRQTDCEMAIRRLIDRFGSIDLLINNAGLTHRSAFTDTVAAVYEQVMAVNFFGALYCTQAALPALIRNRGFIVVMSSIAGFSPLYGRTGYAASKHALHGLFESLRTEVEAEGVGIMMVCPGFTDTDFRFRTLDADGGITDHPQSTVGRMLTPESVAEAIFHAAAGNKRQLVLSTPGRLAWWVNKLSPALYARLMSRALRSELQR